MASPQFPNEPGPKGSPETPFDPSAQGFWPRVRERVSEMTSLEQILWATAGVVAIAALVSLYSTLTSSPRQAAPTPAQAALKAVSTNTPIPTRSLTPTATSTPFPTLLPLEIPTAPADGVYLTFSPDPKRTGWVGSKELGPHWGDRSLQTGVFQGQAFVGLLQFDLRSLAPGSKVLFAAIELTGQNSRYLQGDGQWSLDLIDSAGTAQRDDATYADIQPASSLARVGSALKSQELASNLTKRFTLSAGQLALVQKQLDIGSLTFRLSGPADGKDNLFSWDASNGPAGPTLYLVVVPAQFVVITATPTAANVFAAATLAVQQTGFARQFGTPTAFPRSVATATPGAKGFLVVTSVPVPQNRVTATALAEYAAAYATAVAVTTGTYTPTPANLITTTPTPSFLALSQFTPVPTRLPYTAFEVSRLEQFKTPIPKELGLQGNIVFLTDREGGADPQVYVMNSAGIVLGKLTGRVYYDVASAYDLFSRDKLFQLDVGKDEQGLWQIMQFDIAKGSLRPLIAELPKAAGMGSFNPAYSPVRDEIAYTSEQSGHFEIYSYDVKTAVSKRLTSTPKYPSVTGYQGANKHPSWSPDGKSIVLAADRGPYEHWQITIMDADGGNIRILSPSLYSDWDPIWIK